MALVVKPETRALPPSENVAFYEMNSTHKKVCAFIDKHFASFFVEFLKVAAIVWVGYAIPLIVTGVNTNNKALLSAVLLRSGLLAILLLAGCIWASCYLRTPNNIVNR